MAGIKREPGFYWVLVDQEWRVCEWSNGEWLSPGCELGYTDFYFNIIDERKITRHETKD